MAAGSAKSPVVLITGANRGIGLALVQAYAAKDWLVIATCRNPAHAEDLKALARARPKRVVIETLDVSSVDSIDTLAGKYRGHPIDVLINNAGILGDVGAQVPKNFDAQTFDAVMRTNSYAPLRLSAAFLDNVASSRRKKIVSLTSTAGSIGTAQQQSGLYFYNMSKSALNMGMHLLQKEVRDRGIIVGLIAPAPTDTEMMRQFMRGAAAKPDFLTPAQSASTIIALIDRLTPEMGGRFYASWGDEYPW
jgi:NAD(P)-dependent dehydrogenase (short-subunit alcohol dehydrogenase family)